MRIMSCYIQKKTFVAIFFLDDKKLATNECTNPYTQYLCANKRCISFNAVCDEKDDCGDESDESSLCNYGIIRPY